MHKQKVFFSGLFLLICFTACTSIPSGLDVIKNFDSQRFLGTWYEIARLDHKEERNLQQVTATYSQRADGGIRVLNKGFDTKKQQWKSIEGKGYFNGPSDQGRLKVSFFGPFYGGYNILKLEPDYSLMLVSGPNRKYLWILARDKKLDERLLQNYIQQAKDWGFATDELIRVAHP